MPLIATSPRRPEVADPGAPAERQRSDGEGSVGEDEPAPGIQDSLAIALEQEIPLGGDVEQGVGDVLLECPVARQRDPVTGLGRLEVVDPGLDQPPGSVILDEAELRHSPADLVTGQAGVGGGDVQPDELALTSSAPLLSRPLGTWSSWATCDLTSVCREALRYWLSRRRAPPRISSFLVRRCSRRRVASAPLIRPKRQLVRS
jgi:hypothetical protein